MSWAVVLLLDQEILALDLYESRTHWPLRWTAQDRAGGHVELTAVTRARHRSPIQLALRERAPHMGALVIECVEVSAYACNAHFGSFNIENLHLSREYSSCVSNAYQHDSISYH